MFPKFTGVVELVSDFVVCEEGKPLSPEASRILVSYLLLPISSVSSVVAYSQFKYPIMVGLSENEL